MALLVYSNDFLTLVTATLANVGQNFADIGTLVNGNLRAVNIHDNAGIRATQIADRFNTYHVEKTLIPPNGDVNLDTSPVDFITTTPYSGNYHRLRSKIRTKNGQLKLLCAIDVWIEEASGAEHTIEVLKNGVAIIAGASTIAVAVADPDDQFYEMANDNPLDNPFAAFSNLDILEYRVGLTSGVGPGAIRAVHVTEHWKSELTS